MQILNHSWMPGVSVQACWFPEAETRSSCVLVPWAAHSPLRSSTPPILKGSKLSHGIMEGYHAALD